MFSASRGYARAPAVATRPPPCAVARGLKACNNRSVCVCVTWEFELATPARSEAARAGRCAFGPFELDPVERRLCRDGNDLALPRKSFDLLLALVEAPGRLQPREVLIGKLWPNAIVEEHSLTWNVSALRKAGLPEE